MSHRTPPGRRAPSSKMGRNTYKCDKYRAENRREKNKKRKAETRKRHTRVSSIARRMIQANAGLNERLAQC